MDQQKILETLKNGGVGVLPTDTLYGLVANALDEQAVAKVYALKERSPEKAVIILIASVSSLVQFGVTPDKDQQAFLGKYWPGKVSVILPCQGNKFEYLHRGLGSLAFRVPDSEELRTLLEKTGPIVAPSANREGEPPASSIEQAKMYFGSDVDFYVDAGELKSEPSTIVSLLGDKPDIIRQGAVQVV